MDQNIVVTAQEIRDMKIRGAGRIARAGADAMRKFAESYSGSDIAAFRKDMDEASKVLLDSRPTAVSLWNGVQASMKGVKDEGDIESAKALLISNSEQFIKESEEAVRTIAKIGAKRIEDGDTIMTHCNSSVAIGAIVEAFKQGKDIKVFATESRPWRQGILTVNDLAKEGIDTTLIIDSAVRLVMKKVDKVLVGADTITSHGALVNKIGTSQVAMAAKEARVQFYTCSETYKFSPLTLDGDLVKIEERETSEVVKPGEIPDSVKIYNPVFDITPAQYIDGIITEIGLISPGSVYDVMERKFGTEMMKE
ncbi:MAG: ribose 1,5-bisphosphate isomerase [Candidatus Methanomethylophilaceae archaeon]|nr:ribose 1,5-bisphosphate isomerase [Candidatus Methanomethylophilaceae archaeon]MBR4685245.1 ribose 1,5-bisphosphate isomerase [Candidatus Methanomethylophilaceae archaeon]